VFSVATILTMPKQVSCHMFPVWSIADEQLVVVYLGVIFKEAGERQAGTPKDRRSTIISAVVLVVGFGMFPTLDKR
jgi:hypothetical protein